MKDTIKKTRQYLDYLEEHYDNVQRAWNELQYKCKDMTFIKDDLERQLLDAEIKNHDASKLTLEEFIPYRKKFFPTEEESNSIEETKFNKETESNEETETNVECEANIALQHHIENNDHHWQTWTTKEYAYPNMQKLHCLHMIVDWMAMGYKFGDSPRDYYEKNKEKIKLPDWAVEFIYEIFDRIE